MSADSRRGRVSEAPSLASQRGPHRGREICYYSGVSTLKLGLCLFAPFSFPPTFVTGVTFVDDGVAGVGSVFSHPIEAVRTKARRATEQAIDRDIVSFL